MLDSGLLPLRNQQAVVRAMRREDAGAYAVGTTDPAVRRYAHLPEPAYTQGSVEALIRGEIAEGLERGDLAVLAIADPATDAFAGSVVLFGLAEGSVEVGFWIHPDHRGSGMSSAALALAREFARRSGLVRMAARTVPENLPSQRVLERAGFSRGDSVVDVAPSGDEVMLVPYACELAPLTLLPIETGRLRLRLHEHADTEALHRIYSRPDVARYLLDDPWSESCAARHVSERMAKTGLDDGREALSLVIECDGATIGDVQVWLTDTERRVAEIGWVLDPERGGAGLATEAVEAVLDAGFGTWGLHRVAAQMDTRNEASARLAHRAGMRREAHLRQDWWNKGEWTDTVIYGALASDGLAGSR